MSIHPKWSRFLALIPRSRMWLQLASLTRSGERRFMQWSSYIKIRAHRSPISSIGAKTGSPDTNDQNRSRSLLKTKCRGLRPENFCTEFSEGGMPIMKRAAPKGMRHDGADQIK